MEKQTSRPNLVHLPLERYQARASEFLVDWETSVFQETFNVQRIEGTNSASVSVMTGEVLDRFQRPLSAMEQAKTLINAAERQLGRVYFSDFYHPGLDALAYSRKSFNGYAYCWAQSFDQFDFTREMPWMRAWEMMALMLYKKVFVANEGLADLIMTSLFPSSGSKIEVVGLPFNSVYVRKAVDMSALPSLEYDVIYSSRLDREKNPLFFLELVKTMPSLRFVVCSGRDRLVSNDGRIVEEFEKAVQNHKNLTVLTGLTKGQYYATLSRSKVQLNCSAQDWVSWTLLEALTLGATPCYPNIRSFPETFGENMDYLYAANSLNAARDRIRYLLERPITRPEADSMLAPHDAALHIISKIIANE